MAFIALFVFVLSSSLIADQAEKWAAANPKDPEAPLVLYRAGRWCDIMGANDKAIEIYWKLYQTYPGSGELVAPALYYCAVVKSEDQMVTVLRQQANQYLQIVLDQYQTQTEWHAKAQKLYDEVNYVH